MVVDGIEIENLLSHPVDIKLGSEIYHWEAACKSKKPIVKWKTIKVDNDMFNLDGGSKVVVSINNLPKRKLGKLFLVNSFVLDALVEQDPENAGYFVAPGKQNRERGGKVSYAEGFYYKEFKIKKDKK